jgi:hypothetical protein
MTPIGWVPSTKHIDDEGIEQYVISLPTLVLPHQWHISFASHLASWKAAYLFSNGMVTSMMVTVLQVRSERPIKERYRLVDSNGGGS